MSLTAKRIKSLRERENLTTVELGRELGVSGPAVTHWETDKRDMTVRALRLLCKRFKVSADYILDLDGGA